MQLAGRKCGVCNGEISGVREGRFCGQCSSPVHTRCSYDEVTDRSRCPDCGSPRVTGREVRAEEETVRRNIVRVLARQDIIRGAVAIVAGVVLAIMAFILALATDFGLWLLGTAALIAFAGAGIAARGVFRMARSKHEDYPERHDQ